MKNLKLIFAAFALAFILIAFGCEKEHVEPDPGTRPSMDTGVALRDPEPEYPRSKKVEARCDTLCCPEGFEPLNEKND
jgi:hypothetical protein